MPSRIVVAIVSLVCAAAARAQTPPPVAGAQDAATAAAPLAEVTVEAPQPRYVAPTQRDRIGRIWAPVYLDGQGPFRLVLDTGANRSVIVPRVLDQLGYRDRVDRTVRVRGVTGTAVVPVVRIGRMEIGDLVLQPAMLPIVADVFGGADGVLGNDGLQDKRIVIDFRNDSITVKRSRREPPGPGFQTLPINFLRDRLLGVDVMVGGIRTKAVIDTGAPDSLGNEVLRAALKRRPPEELNAKIIGVTLDVEQGDRVRLPTIRIQNIRIQGATMTFSDVHLFKYWRLTDEPAIMIGMDVLGVLDQIIIDYRTRQLHLRTREN
ncbi:MAG: aspartyl protease family protein [Sinobacteraceae bacterium]|nr:aspartyl protease family protein [Nevskiaceae bacterium]MCP5360242.1 aspartyl protease family protein [Nevskiaceae bacterium]MCP5466621.1 aspartyl protease family protein [Nevskiaceae bacterium]